MGVLFFFHPNQLYLLQVYQPKLKKKKLLSLRNIPFTISSPTNVVTHLFKSNFTLKCFNSTYVMSWLFSVEMVSVCAWWLVFIFLAVEVVSSRVICCMLITFRR